MVRHWPWRRGQARKSATGICAVSSHGVNRYGRSGTFGDRSFARRRRLSGGCQRPSLYGGYPPRWRPCTARCGGPRRFRCAPAHGFAGLCLHGPSTGDLADNLAQRFPTIHATCVNTSSTPPPLCRSTGRAFHMGGIRTEPAVAHLPACGMRRSRRTGAHGANRLASTTSKPLRLVRGSPRTLIILCHCRARHVRHHRKPELMKMDIHAPVTARVRTYEQLCRRATLKRRPHACIG